MIVSQWFLYKDCHPPVDSTDMDTKVWGASWLTEGHADSDPCPSWSCKPPGLLIPSTFFSFNQGNRLTMKILLSSLDRWEGWDPEVFLIIIFMVLPLPSSSEEIWVSVFYSFLCLPPSPDLRRAPRSPPLAVMTLRSLSHSLSVTGWTRKVTWWNAGISI